MSPVLRTEAELTKDGACQATAAIRQNARRLSLPLQPMIRGLIGSFTNDGGQYVRFFATACSGKCRRRHAGLTRRRRGGRPGAAAVRSRTQAAGWQGAAVL